MLANVLWLCFFYVPAASSLSPVCGFQLVFVKSLMCASPRSSRAHRHHRFLSAWYPRLSSPQLARWLCFANAVSALLAVAVVVAGAFSLSRASVLGLQWCAITAVCLGSLLLLLALLGTAGARLRNRFSLLGFTALEGAVAFGLLLSGTWCLALAGGSATISDFTWEAMSKEVSEGLASCGGRHARMCQVVRGACGLWIG